MEQQTTGQSQETAKGDRNPPVILHAKPYENSGEIEWALDFAQDPPRGKKVDVNLPKNSGGHTIIINLVQASGITFSAVDPIWVVKNGSCPPPAGSSSPLLRVVRCEEKTLRLFDSNDGNACTLDYQLNFNGAPPFDPRIINGGDI